MSGGVWFLETHLMKLSNCVQQLNRSGRAMRRGRPISLAPVWLAIFLCVFFSSATGALAVCGDTVVPDASEVRMLYQLLGRVFGRTKS